MTLKEYETKHNAKVTKHRDGTVTVKYQKQYRNGDFNAFTDNLTTILRGFKRRLGLEYITDPKTFNWSQYKEKGIVKVRATFK